MNRIILTGNLVRDPELRTTQSGLAVCSFTIAVTKRRTAEAGKPDADFFRIVTWKTLAENCARFLAKGRKAGVVGSVTMSSYTAKDGTTKSSMEVSADEVEFLSPRSDADDSGLTPPTDEKVGFIKVEDDDDLPF